MTERHQDGRRPELEGALGVELPETIARVIARDRYEPARKVRNRWGRTISKVRMQDGRTVIAEGRRERDTFRMLQLFPQLIAVKEQPFTIPYTYDRRSGECWLGHHHGNRTVEINDLVYTACTPDVLCEFADGRTVLIEIWAADPEVDSFVRKRAACARFAAQRGWLFRVITSERLEAPDLLAIRTWMNYRMTPVPFAVRAAALEALWDAGALPCGELAARLDPDVPRAVAQLFALVAQGHLGADMFTPPSPRAHVWQPQGTELEQVQARVWQRLFGEAEAA